MPIRVTCPGCHRTFRVEDQHAGRRGRCPDCGEIVRVPDEELPRFDPVEDEPDDHYAEDDVRPRRRPGRGRTPLDDLPAWRRVSTGYLIQQAGVGLSLLALALVMAGMTILSDDPADLEKEPTVGQTVATCAGALAGLLAIVLLCVGRFMSAGAPVGAPRALGLISAIGVALQVPALCLVGGLAIVLAANAQGNADAGAVVVGLGMFAYMALWVGCEATHCFALASVGRVLRTDGLRVMGSALGVGVIVAGFVVMVGLCGFGAWADANNPNPNGANPAANRTENEVMLVGMIGTALITGFYLMLDIVLLQRGRATIRQIADLDATGAEDDDWR